MLSFAELEKVVGTAAANKFYKPLYDAMGEFGIDTPLRVAAFIAQAMHESMNFTRLEENLNYSWDALRKLFPKYFDTDVLAQRYHRRPAIIASRLYANRNGNGDEASGDGWTYRGRGLFQLTGKANYAECSQALFGDSRLVDNPDGVLDYEVACRSAAWFWTKNKLNQLADQEDMKGITRKINGGYIGLKERQDNYDKVLAAFGG